MPGDQRRRFVTLVHLVEVGNRSHVVGGGIHVTDRNRRSSCRNTPVSVPLEEVVDRECVVVDGSRRSTCTRPGSGDSAAPAQPVRRVRWSNSTADRGCTSPSAPAGDDVADRYADVRTPKPVCGLPSLSATSTLFGNSDRRSSASGRTPDRSRRSGADGRHRQHVRPDLREKA